MEKRIILMIFLVSTALFSCDLYPDYDGYYLASSDYSTLLNRLEGEDSIDYDVIDKHLEALDTSTSYAASVYTSGAYVCRTLLWKNYNDDGFYWNYYVSVDIWTEYGSLNRGMCSYYAD